LAASNALAICTRVIVFLTIPTSHLMEMPRKLRRNQKQEGPVVRFIYPNRA